MLCSDLTTCKTCTISSACYWSLVGQMCMYDLHNKTSMGRMRVYQEEKCPKITVLNKSGVGLSTHTLQLTINGSHTDFLRYLRHRMIVCCMESLCMNGTIIDSTIVCSKVVLPSVTTASVFSFTVKANTALLSFDNETDYFFTVYNYNMVWCNQQTLNENCDVCTWTSVDTGDINYLKWCSAGNRCSGPAVWYKKIERPKGDNALKTLAYDELLVPADRCPAIHFLSVEQSWASVSENMTLVVEVTNHRLFLGNRTMAVTVAQRKCADPATVNDSDAITCIVARSDAMEYPQDAGPIKVTYIMDNNVGPPTKLTFTSQQTVEFTDFDITNVAPESVPCSGGTIMTVTFVGRLPYNTVSTIVTVAGRLCLNSKVVGNGTITCTCTIISSDHVNDVNGSEPRTVITEGPVVVTLVSRDDIQLRVASRMTVRLVSPLLTDGFDPVCGSVQRDAQITVMGTDLDAGNDVSVFLHPGRWPCVLVERDRNRITCRSTTVANGLRALTVDFDQTLTSRLEVPPQSVADRRPILDPVQRFEAVASGGTSVTVRGRQFGCVTNASILLRPPGTTDDVPVNVTDCQITDDTTAVCRSPSFTDVDEEATNNGSSVSALVELYARVRFNDLERESPPWLWTVYPDPEYSGFDTDENGVVVIHGNHLDRGYENGDLAIRFQNSETVCTVLLVTQHRIECEPVVIDVSPENAIEITVGDRLRYTVLKTRINASIAYQSWYAFSAVSACATTVIIVVALIVCMKKKQSRKSKYAVSELTELKECEPQICL